MGEHREHLLDKCKSAFIDLSKDEREHFVIMAASLAGVEIKSTETPEEKPLDAIEQVEWNGEGLPPVGLDCEVRFRTEDGEWTDWFSDGKFKAGYDSKLWFSHEFGDCVHPAHDVEFRKPETPEAKKEREELELINEVSDILNTKGFGHDQLMLKCLLSHGYLSNKGK